MNFIENVSLKDVRKAHHFDPGPNNVLISILDPDFPGLLGTTKFRFKNVFGFRFFDTEDDGPGAITDKQAREIVYILKHALDTKANVIVHCHAGLCRSGAVVEAGITMGFTDPEKERIPNLLVKKKLLENIGPLDHVNNCRSVA